MLAPTEEMAQQHLDVLHRLSTATRSTIFGSEIGALVKFADWTEQQHKFGSLSTIVQETQLVRRLYIAAGHYLQLICQSVGQKTRGDIRADSNFTLLFMSVCRIFLVCLEEEGSPDPYRLARKQITASGGLSAHRMPAPHGSVGCLVQEQYCCAT